MSAKPVTLQNLLTNAPQEEAEQDTLQALLSWGAPCKFIGMQDLSLDQISGSHDKEDKGKILFDLLSIFFPSLMGETYHWLEGEEIPPFKIYKLGDRYYAADDRGLLAAARHRGLAFILAEVWEFTKC